jgi:hypothetical protein
LADDEFLRRIFSTIRRRTGHRMPELNAPEIYRTVLAPSPRKESPRKKRKKQARRRKRASREEVIFQTFPE